jgi:hypothetical protein
MTVVALMATLPCGQSDISQTAIRGLKAMNFTPKAKRKPPEDFNMNRDDRQEVYAVFEQLGDPGIALVGAFHILLVC